MITNPYNVSYANFVGRHWRGKSLRFCLKWTDKASYLKFNTNISSVIPNTPFILFFTFSELCLFQPARLFWPPFPHFWFRNVNQFECIFTHLPFYSNLNAYSRFKRAHFRNGNLHIVSLQFRLILIRMISRKMH